MESISDKVKHVKAARQTREHDCHWPGCGKQVPPAKWGCVLHWYMLPQRIRNAIWRAYSSGQESRFDPSREYLNAANWAQAWIVCYGSRYQVWKALTPGEQALELSLLLKQVTK